MTEQASRHQEEIRDAMAAASWCRRSAELAVIANVSDVASEAGGLLRPVPAWTMLATKLSSAELFYISGRKQQMNYWWSRRIVVIAVTAILLSPISLFAQGEEGSNTGTTALTDQQQTAANSAFCSALSSVTPSPSTAGAATLLTPAVMSVASSAFSSSTHIPLGPATSLLKGYVSQHAAQILASCGINSATQGLGSEIPSGGSLPSVPKMP
jgi:hypothetical protein